MVLDCAAVFEKIRVAGYGFTTEAPVTTPSGRPVAYFHDPDDILVEILQYPR